MSQFKKAMSPVDAFGIALGAIIGWGCFVLPGSSFLPQAGPGGAALGLALGALLILVISQSYGYLMTKHPVAGGEFAYTHRAFGRTHGFICGWALTLTYTALIPLNATAIAMIFRYLFPGVLQVTKLYTVAGWDVYLEELLVAFTFIILIAVINLRGVKGAAWVQTGIAFLLLGTILLVTVLAAIKQKSAANLFPLFENEAGKPCASGVFSIVAMAPWVYIGFDCIPHMAEEYNFSTKKMNVLMVLSILAALLCYVCVNTLTALAVPWQSLVLQDPLWATGISVELTVGKLGLILIGISMFCAVVAGMNAFYMSSSRLIYAMAQENMLFQKFGQLDAKNGVPKPAVLFVCGVSLVAPLFGREVMGWIVDMTSICGALAFAYTTAAAVKTALRERSKAHAVWGVAGLAVSIFLLILLVIPGMPGFLSIQSLCALLIWAGLGCVFWHRSKRVSLNVRRQKGSAADQSMIGDTSPILLKTKL